MAKMAARRALERLRIHGEPPALMLSFNGLESSVLLVDEFWDYLARSVPGELVVGVPARDVVLVTGSGSAPGVERIRRAVERVFYAGGEHPHTVSRELQQGRFHGRLYAGPVRLHLPADVVRAVIGQRESDRAHGCCSTLPAPLQAAR